MGEKNKKKIWGFLSESIWDEDEGQWGRKAEAKENRRSGFQRVKSGWIRTEKCDLWQTARTCAKDKSKKGSTRLILSMDQYSTGNLNINQSFIDSFIHSKTCRVHVQCAWLCSKVKNNLILLTYILIVFLSYPSSSRESRGLGRQTLIFSFTG